MSPQKAQQVEESCDAVKLNVSQTAAPLTEKETDHPDLSHVDEVNHLTSIQQLELKGHPDQLREDEDQKRRPVPSYTSGDLVLVTKPNQNNKNAGVTSKFMPRRDGPFVIVERKSPVSHSVANTDSPQLSEGVYHTSALTPFQGNIIPPVKALCRRGRPARIIKPSSPTPANAQIHKCS
ncbi:uncharacterized protein NPIL_211441 [Nephila pilipes]|uniref:Uncharacterized protein n=1 Tax=Nephila pilipes TaxID=299642 RepID=A0A8X6MHL0_NEPPI|nr:uncharacterized protein NPIL_211441 [Nephila pilipes]